MIVWLEQTECRDAAKTGGKAANLSRLAADFPVPTGFCLTTDAFARWGTTLQGDSGSLPQEVQELVHNGYAILSERIQMSAPPVAVRSSAIGEDGQSASFAGQYDTFLNVSGVTRVIEAVARCWASAGADRVQRYHHHQTKTANANGQNGLAVLVQELVPADVSLVAFSVNPVNQAADEIVINGNWGLGDSLVSGSVTPDTYIVRKRDLSVLDCTIAAKERMTILVESGVRDVMVPRPMRKKEVLRQDQLSEVARLACRLEDRMGWPVDIECAYHADRLYLLQCRPISTLR